MCTADRRRAYVTFRPQSPPGVPVLARYERRTGDRGAAWSISPLESAPLVMMALCCSMGPPQGEDHKGARSCVLRFVGARSVDPLS